MLIRKPNENMPIENNQKSDKVVIDGLMTAEDLTVLGQEAGTKTIEQLRSLYPRDIELEKREMEIMTDEALTKKLRAAGKDNDEKINSIYQNQLLKNKIRETRSEIQRLNKEYQKSHEENLIFEKDRKIRELENELEKARQKLQ